MVRGQEFVSTWVGTVNTQVLGTVPPGMVAEIYGMQFANPAEGTVHVQLYEQREGTITATIEGVALTPGRTERKGYSSEPIGYIHSEQSVVGVVSPSGSVQVTMVYRYVPGRTNIP